MKADDFEYSDGETICRGYLACNEKTPRKRPGVLVIHEAGGLGAHALKRTRMLAELGYVALAADLYGGRKQAKTRDEMQAFMDDLTRDTSLYRARARAGLNALSGVPNVDTSRIGAIGFCFGGATVLELARDGAPLKGVVSFHGLLKTKAPARPGVVEAKILVCNGADDPMVPPHDVTAFEEEMRAAKADWQVINYDGTVHSFMNPWADGKDVPGTLYNAQSAAHAWTAMQTFFDGVLGPI